MRRNWQYFKDTLRSDSNSDSEPLIWPRRRLTSKGKAKGKAKYQDESDSDSEPVVRPGRRAKPKPEPKGKGKAVPESDFESGYESSFVVSDSYISYADSYHKELD
jgi:hypothetical protein